MNAVSRRLCVIPVREGELPRCAMSALANRYDHVVLIGTMLGTAAAALAGVVEHLSVIEVEAFAPGTQARGIAQLAEGYDVVAFPAGGDGRDLAVRVAAHLNRPLVVDAVESLDGSLRVRRYGGRIDELVTLEAPYVVTIEYSELCSVMPHGTTDEAVMIRSMPGIERSDADVRVVSVVAADATSLDLHEATRIVGGGAGLMERKDARHDRKRFDLLERVGNAIGAPLGVTRVVTDAGHAPHTRQIGTTGVVVSPELYLAFGISGAVQHTSGLGSPQHCVSVNTDPHCPMMAMADLAIVADAHETLVCLGELLGVDDE